MLVKVNLEVKKQVISKEEAYRRSEIIKALSESTRICIIDFLRINGGNVNVQDITDITELAQPTISHHLRILSSVGIISCQKRGLECFYFINSRTLDKAMSYIRDMYPVKGENNE